MLKFAKLFMELLLQFRNLCNEKNYRRHFGWRTAGIWL